MPALRAFSIRFLLLLPAILASPSRAVEPQEPWRPAYLRLWTDANQSSEAGGDGIMALQYGLGRLENAALPPRLWQEDRFWPHLGGIGYRLMRYVFVGYPMAVAEATFQHEYFGHGFRGREGGATGISYEIDLPPPYGRGGGLTGFGSGWDFPHSWDALTLVNVGGVEAEGVAADRIRLAWMQTGSIDPGEALLYLSLRDNLGNYLRQSFEDSIGPSGPTTANDMLAYIWNLNRKQTNLDRADWKLHLRRIKNQENWSWADPFRFYAYGSLIVTDLLYGRTSGRLAAIPLGPVRYLPAIGYGLGPWGPEYRIDNLFAWDGRALQIGYRFGDDTFRSSWGWDAVSSGILRVDDWILDLDAHYWLQPKLQVDPPAPWLDSRAYPRESGYAAGLQAASPAWIKRVPVRAWAGAGWKSRGWMRGRDWQEGPYWRLGLAWTPARPEASSAGR